MTKQLNLIREHSSNGLPFVWYRVPNGSQVHVMLQNNNEVYTYEPQNKLNGYVFAPFDKNRSMILFPDNQCKNLTVGLWRASWKKLDPTKISEDDQIDYEKIISEVIKSFSSDGLQKLVLSRRVDYLVDSLDAFSAFSALANSYLNAYAYCVFHPAVGLWMGATPEPLAHVKDGQLTTVALAGTRMVRERNNTEWGKKESLEQQMVVDDISNVLEPYAEEYQQSEKETIRSAHLEHLRTEVSIKLKDNYYSEYLKVARQLHPTAAVCGLPRSLSYSKIVNLERYQRSFYAGFLGKVKESEGHLDLYVNLRCMTFQNGVLSLFAGGGITEDSNPTDEYYETEQKLDTLRTILFS